MAKFYYKAKQCPEEIVNGSVEAESLDGAVAKILQMGYTPLDVKGGEEHEEKKAPKLNISFKSLLDFSRKIPPGETARFIRQLGDLLDAGVPVLRTLGIIGKQIKHPHFKEVVEQMTAFVKDGGTLSSALALFPEMFSPLYINIVRAGEVGGNLNIALNRLADFVEKDQEIRAQIRGSLFYPVFILILGSVSIFILITWFIPQITAIFEDLSEKLPLPTVILINTSHFFSQFWWAILGFLGVICFYYKRFQNTLSGQLWLDKMKLKSPLLGDFIKDAEVGRLARTLGTLLDNGVVIVTALESASLVLENRILRQEVQKISKEVANGESLTEAVQMSTLFSDAAVSMIAVGEETGKIHEGLYKLALFYEKQTQRFIKNVLSLLEPILILSIGIIVFFIVIAMLMPVFRMNLMIQ